MKIINIELDLAVANDICGQEITTALERIIGDRIMAIDVVGGEGVTSHGGKTDKPAKVKKAKVERDPNRPKRKYTRRAKVAEGDKPAYERTPAMQKSGTTVVRDMGDGNKVEIRK